MASLPNERGSDLSASYDELAAEYTRRVARELDHKPLDCELRGRLFLSFHIGDEVLHLDELWNHPVCMDFILFRTDEMLGYLESAGFDIEELVERDPYPDVEYQSRRAYIVARKRNAVPQ